MPLFSHKKKYILMHRDIPVVSGEYSFKNHEFDNAQVLNEKHLPVGVVKNGKFSRKLLNDWISWRGIPDYRVGLTQLLDRLGVQDPMDLLERSNMLSVSDCYWLKEEKEELNWGDINFFHRSFDDRGFATAMFARVSYKADRSARHTPNNTTAGYQLKAWLRQGGSLKLIKGGTGVQQEPVNEWLAYKAAQYLGMDAIPYDLGIYEDKVVSICEDMCDEHTDLVTAKDVMRGVHVPEGEFSYPYFLDELQKHGITNAQKCINDMLVLDYLMLNTDRHTQNLGILVDADTNEWLRCAPIYDTGTSLGCLLEDADIGYAESQKKTVFFNARGMYADQLLQLIDLSGYDFTGLEKLAQEYGNQLVKYQKFTGISDVRIEGVYRLFYKRVLKLKKLAARRR